MTYSIFGEQLENTLANSTAANSLNKIILQNGDMTKAYFTRSINDYSWLQRIATKLKVYQESKPVRKLK